MRPPFVKVEGMKKKKAKKKKTKMKKTKKKKTKKKTKKSANCSCARLIDYLEFFVKGLDVILDPLDELGLILSDGTPDVRSDEEGVEARKDAEHLVGVLRRSQLVAETSRDTSLNAVM